MADFVRGDCHKCKYETSAECVPRSQKMGFPICYQSTTTNADRIRSMTDEELAEAFANACPEDKAVNRCCQYFAKGNLGCRDCWLDWLKQEAT